MRSKFRASTLIRRAIDNVCDDVVGAFSQRPFLDYHNYVNVFNGQWSAAHCFSQVRPWRDVLAAGQVRDLDA